MSLKQLALTSALILAAVTAHAGECPRSTALGMMSPDWPSYEAYVIEVTPPGGRAIDWLALHAPGLLVRPRAEVDSTPAAYAADLFVATLPVTSATALVESAKALGTTAVFGPLRLSAAWGQPANYRERKSFNFVKSTTRTSEGEVIRTETASENIILDVQTTGIPGIDSTEAQTEVKLSWQQVTGWLTRETPRTELAVNVTWEPGTKRELTHRKEKTTVKTKEPTVVRSTMTNCASLAPGEAVLFGGIQGLMMQPDGESDTYRELAILLRKLPN